MLTCCIDWLTFVIKLDISKTDVNYINDLVDDLQNYILPKNSTRDACNLGWIVGHGRYGYQRSYSYNGIEILFDGNCSICVNITGSGCRTYEDIHGKFDSLLGICVINKYKVTRLDLAVDDRDPDAGLLNIVEIYRLSDMFEPDKCFVTGEFQSINRIQGTSGCTCYYGSNASDRRVKIYDKAAEQKLLCEKWVRVELTLRNGFAFSAIEKIHRGALAGDLFCDVVGSYLSFLTVPDSSFDRSHIARDSKDYICLWWSEFLSNAKGLILTGSTKKVKTVAGLKNYIENQVPRSLALYQKLYGSAAVAQIIADGSRRLNLDDKRILADNLHLEMHPVLKAVMTKIDA